MIRATLSWLLVIGMVLVPAGAQRGEKVKAEAYGEYYRKGMIIVDGQRFVEGPKTRYKGVSSIERVPLGSEVKAEGRRQSDGTVVAEKIEVRPNEFDSLDEQVWAATRKIEEEWVKAGEMYQEDREGRRQVIGKILESGPAVERARTVTRKLLPPYLGPSNVRVRVVETKEWNASAMGNGAIWVYSGLLNDMNDQELAIILGHELAHFTHEHVKRNFQKAQKAQWFGLAAAIGIGVAGGRGAAADVAGLGASLGLSALMSGYSRDFEDQADRVGLRYAYEAGYDPAVGVDLWERFREKYGEQDQISNFLMGSHSRPTDRIRNIRQELAINYSAQ